MLLRAGRARFAYHGGPRLGGLGIAKALYERIGWTHWRFGAADYLAAPGSAGLTGRPQPTPWDPALSEAMLRRGIRVEEELVLGELLVGLRSGR